MPIKESPIDLPKKENMDTPTGRGMATVSALSTEKANIVEAIGNFDHNNASVLGLALQEASMEEIATPSALGVIVDLRRVTFIDSATLAALMRTYSALTAAQRSLCVMLLPGSQAERALRVMRFTTVIRVVHDWDDLA